MAKILLVDDDSNLIEVLERMLTKAGHNVQSAKDGEEAVKVFEWYKPEFVILDVILPGRNGFEVLRHVKDEMPDVKVIFFSGYRLEGLVEEARQLGAYGFIEKGGQLNTLIDLIDKAAAVKGKCAQNSDGHGQTHPIRILIGDDEPMILEVLERFLKEKNYCVACAHDGQEALDKIEDFHPHLVLLDLSMPKKDGLQVLDRIKKDKPETGVIIISGNQVRESAAKAFELGAFDYIPKPIDFAYLENSIRTWSAGNHKE